MTCFLLINVFPTDKPKIKTSLSQADLQPIIDRWATAAQNCLDGDFADPKVGLACDERVKTVKILQDHGYCYGTESHAEYDWHKCAKNSHKE